ncbi:putative transcriptional regulatory protein NarL [Pontiella desulfatans]|uniref:Putative transcriptional regulatory protein NarL n=1 Tax=Pontiella desulfatans TaxID=2750659 RepID=A0A6C2U6B3_PONDE|nr:response regulator transcription factor [Pontiella desulfatans]VGO15443.1 putative transcriptional regulatory protein NarL [Pontiella desulfatans]
MNASIKIMLVEDHPEYREILEFVFAKKKGLELVSQFGNAELALRTLQDGGRAAEPDIILLDLNLPGMSGLDAMPWISKYAPDTRVIILSQSDHEADVLRAIQQGAAGYLLKSATMDEITTGIRTVMDGGATLEPSLARFILKTLQPRLPKVATECGISEREREVLSLIAKGLSQKEISSQLKISTYTVTDHLKHIYEKLNVPNAPSAIDKAHRLGLFTSNGS